ncbi:NfeD family protein [Synechococcus elongatus]|uniref:NfeD-like C-terminal domain-containing protein n=2 Tax=Synechococcus elongatus TaxID=32046 RepID=Q31K89_SYNE7|nr:NfeD family protein [Synechococcus elongatus]ABB58530.1 conserved hypothetical protein [Synechococcus elongatus PCC 7942 = FACHB-805]AJD57016.1 hypothetical protein M744_03735 [Synechococcus elongatus UTEX 2973]MBD2587249.1 hypothetical protein [Synechococcus elongatus FACHB-242]MBD2688318.1 hypothetical protein [Synechococcus elongatus FACHB-1061]MBD2705970.1 hypothetical protein [Synechococcus elongatus PCC 7942 = FACHB-805]
MISVYWFCFLFGGIFVALAAVGGLDHDFGHDFDSDFDHSFDAEAAVEPDVAADVDLPEPPSSGRRLWLPITSFKFWTFGLCFFGMTGLLLGWLNPNLPGSLQLGLAIAMGLLLGTGMAGLLRQLRNRQVDSLVRSTDLVGARGIVVLPFNAQSRGKVQLEVKNSVIELSACTDSPLDFQRGDEVVVLRSEGQRLWVIGRTELDLQP